MNTTNMSDKKPGVSDYLKAGLLAGAIAATVNILIYLALVLFGGPDWVTVIIVSILIASVLPNFLASLAYYGLSRLTKKWAYPLLVLGVLAFVLISILPHLGIGPAPSSALSLLPEGFDLVTVPLHIVFGLSAILIVPKLISKISSPMQ